MGAMGAMVLTTTTTEFSHYTEKIAHRTRVRWARWAIFSVSTFFCAPILQKTTHQLTFSRLLAFFINNVKLSALWSIDYGSFHSCCLTHCQRTLSIWPREDAERRTVLSTEPFSKPDRSMTERSSWQNGLFLEDAFRANLAVRVLISE